MANISIGCWQNQIYETHNVNNEEVNEETVEDNDEYRAKGTLRRNRIDVGKRVKTDLITNR